MLILLSPSKTIRNEKISISGHSVPFFANEIEILIEKLKKLNEVDLGKLMDISPKLSALNYQRFQNFQTQEEQACIFAYLGDVYETLQADIMQKEDLEYANKHLRIISGLYGILRPFDMIKPYRLEMGIHLKTQYGKNLYEFWGNKISVYIENELKHEKFIINLASQEYAKVANLRKLKFPVYDIIFKEKKEDQLKVIGLLAKKARGMMANFLIKNRITNIEDLKKFNIGNYQFMKNLSSDTELVFVRS